MIGAPKNCPLCLGQEKVDILFDKFVLQSGHCGHARCKKCHITFDTNVNDIDYSDIDSEDTVKELDVERYTELFVEYPEIADESDNIYGDFEWDNNDELQSGVSDQLIDSIVKYHSGPMRKVADVGCGNGFMTRRIVTLYPDVVVHAIDPSPLVGKLSAVRNVSPHQGTLQTAQLEHGSVDVVSIIGNWMLHIDPANTLIEASSVLRSGGTLVIDFKNIRSMSRVVAIYAFRLGLNRLGGEKLLQRNFLNMRYGFNKGYVDKLLQTAGFDVIDVSSKSPRLLEFKNKSAHQRGLVGLVWRIFDWIDNLRDEKAWVQIVAVKR